MQTISIIQSLGLLLLSVGLALVSGFQAQNGNSRIIGGVCPRPLLLLQSSTNLKLSSEVNSDFERPSTFLDDDDDDDDMNVEFYDDDDDDDDDYGGDGGGRGGRVRASLPPVGTFHVKGGDQETAMECNEARPRQRPWHVPRKVVRKEEEEEPAAPVPEAEKKWSLGRSIFKGGRSCSVCCGV